MKQVTVRSANGQVEVKLNNANDGDRLTPSMAASARNIAFGAGANVTVSDDSDVYRVTKSGVRKQKQEW